MKTALIISSQVAASRVGASASAFCLQRLGVNTIVLPTTLLGRHPGWGPPGGGAVDAARLTDMWQAIAAQDIRIDGVLTGYMADIAHIAPAADIIKSLKAGNPDLITVVDPVMGDHGKLYVPEPIARGIIEDLLPLADYDTPNLWELGYMTGLPTESPAQIINAASALTARTVVTSVPAGDDIGAMLCTPQGSWLVAHPKFTQTPHGGGDSLAGTFLGRLLTGSDPKDALALATASIFEILKMAEAAGDTELPLVRGQDALVEAKGLPPNPVYKEPHD